MPNKFQSDSIRAHQSATQSLIDSAEKYGDKIGAYQLKVRADRLNAELESLGAEDHEKASLTMLFEGKPVVGSRGIQARFSSSIVKRLQELVSGAFALHEYGDMGKRGPIAMGSQSEFLITDFARGSVGFVLEEASDQSQLTDSALKTVTDEVITFLEKTSSEDEQEFQDVLVDMNGRFLAGLKEFFVALDSNEATMKVMDRNRGLNFDSRSIERARQRTEAIEIEEDEVRFSGILDGFLPEHRKFEFTTNEGESLYGTVHKDCAAAIERMNIEGQSPIKKTCEISTAQRVVQHLQKEPRITYLLLDVRLVDSEKISST